MDSKFNYFAYGSNMLTERLIQRCPSTKAVGVAFVDGYSLEFSKISKDGSGKATIVKSPDQRQYGVVFMIEKCDLNNLNDAEGLGKGYDLKCHFNVTLADTGLPIVTKTYTATKGHKDPSLKPFDWYLALVVAGAVKHQLPETVIASHKSSGFISDSCEKRRSENLGILKKAGFENIEQILG